WHLFGPSRSTGVRSWYRRCGNPRSSTSPRTAALPTTRWLKTATSTIPTASCSCVAGVAVFDLARRMGIGVPDRRAFAVIVPCALDLVRRGGGAPVEALGKLPRRIVNAHLAII